MRNVIYLFYCIGGDDLTLKLNYGGWKRYFSVPCAVADSWLKLADGPALKLILYILSCDGTPSLDGALSATGLSRESIDEAVSFWKSLGVLCDDDGKTDAVPAAEPEKSPEAPSAASAPKIVRTGYHPKDIAEMLLSDAELKELFGEAESTLGRLLKHADHETLISLRDYYGFGDESIVLILGYCADLGKTSARYYESVAKSLYEKGCTEFHQIEREFEAQRERHSFEGMVKSDFGIDVKLSPKQSELIESWKEMGFGIEMISLARTKCVDSINKLSFPYINKILKSWQDKGYFTPEAAEADVKPQKSNEHSFDMDEFDLFTLGTDKEKK